MPRTFKDVIDAWGIGCDTVIEGHRRLAADIGTTPEHVKQMRRRDSISSDYWPSVVEAAAKRKLPGWITLEALARMRVVSKGERAKRVGRRRKSRANANLAERTAAA